MLRRLGPGTSPDLESCSLARSFSQLTSTNVAAGGIALAAGCSLSFRRTVLMSRQGDVVRGATLRWTFDTLAVIVLGGLASALKQAFVYRRRAVR